MFHRLVFSEDKGTWAGIEARSAVDPDAVVARVLDRAQLQHLRARGRHLEHLLEAHERQLAGVRDDPRVGGEHARDIGVDLAHLGADRRRQRDRGRVRAAAPERRHIAARRDSLKAGDEHDPVLVQRLADAVRAHIEDPCLRVGRVGDDPCLRSGQRDRAVAEVVDRHRAQRAGDPLARREQHVHLAAGPGCGETSSAIAISSSVVWPRAERTATTRLPPRAGRRSAARRA